MVHQIQFCTELLLGVRTKNMPGVPFFHIVNDSLAIDMVLGGKVDSVATASSEVVECLGRVPEKSELILPRDFV